MRAPRDLKPRPLSVSLARFSSAVAVCATMLAASKGATLYWDADGMGGNNSLSGSGLGGSGIWNTTSPNWWTGIGANEVAFSTGDTAVFRSVNSGTVTLGTPITVQNLIFNTNEYVLTGTASQALTFQSGAIVNLSDRAGNALNATINTALAGSGFTLNGNGGTLTLNFEGAQSAAVPLTIRSGTIQANAYTPASTPSTLVPSTLAPTTALTFDGSGAFRVSNLGLPALPPVDPDQDPQPPTPPPPPQLDYLMGALSHNAGDGVVQIERVTTQAQDIHLTFASMTARAVGATGLFNVTGDFTDPAFPLADSSLSTNAKISITNPAGIAANSFMTGYFARSQGGFGRFAWYDSGGFVRELIYQSDPNTETTNGANSLTVGAHWQLTGTRNGQASVSILSLALSGASSLQMANGSLLTVSNAGGAGSILKTGGGSSTISTADGAGGIQSGAANRELIIRTDAANDTLTISAPITALTGALVKSGEGTLILSGTKDFAGATYLNGGRLTIRGTAAAGAAGEVFLAGGTYELLGYGDNNANAQSIVTNKNVTVTGGGTLTAGRLTPATDVGANKTLTFGTLSIGNQTLTADPAVYVASVNPPIAASGTYALAFTGAVTFRDALSPTFNVTGTQATGSTPALTLGGVISGSSGLIKRGTGTLALTNAGNLFGGMGAAVELQQGVISISSNGALGNPNNTLLLNAGDATDALLTTGTFTIPRAVSLAAARNTFEVSSGTLTLSGPVTSNVTANLVKRGAGTLELTNATNVFGGADGVVDIQAGTLQISVAGALGGAGNLVQLSGGTFAVSTALTLANDISIGTTSGTINAGGNLVLSGQITSAGTVGSLIKTGSGSLTLTNATNTFGGIGTTLDIQGGGSLTVSSGGALGNPANTVKLSGGFFATGTSSASQAFTLAQPATATFDVSSGNTFTLTGSIGQTAVVDFVKAGAGTLELTGINTFGGAAKIIDITGGFLAASSNESLGAITNTLKLNVVGGGFRALGTFATGARPVLLSQSSNRIDVTQGNTLTLDTAFALGANGNSLVKEDLGTLVLTKGNANWTGTITINAGAVRVSGEGTLALGSNAVGNGTTITNIGSLELAGAISVAEPLRIETPGDNTTMSGSGFGGVLRSVAGGNTYSGPIVIANAPSASGAFRNVVFAADGGGASLNLNNSSSIAVDVGTDSTRVSNIILAGDGGGVLSSTISKTGGLNGQLRLIKTGSAASIWTVASPNSAPALDELEIRSGTLKVTSTSNNPTPGTVFASATDLTFAGGGIFSYDNGTNVFVAKSQTLDTLSFKSGDGSVSIQRSSARDAFLTFTNPVIARLEGATGFFQAAGTNSTFSGTPNAKVTLPSQPDGFINSGLFAQQTVPTSATTFAWYSGGATGTVRPIVYGSDANTAIASTALTLGQGAGMHVQVSNGAQVTSMGNVSLASLNVLGGVNIDLNAGAVLTINSGGAGAILKTGLSNTATISGGANSLLTTGDNTRELIIRVGDLPAESLSISTSIGNTGALTKSGSGTLTLSGVNSWSGNTYVNGGTLLVRGAQAFSSNSTGLTIGGGLSPKLSFEENGDGFSRRQQIDTLKNVTVTGAASIEVGKVSIGVSQALNKTITFTNLSIGNQVLTITPSAGYGVRFTGSTVLNEALPTTFSVAGSSASNVVPGLILGGVVSSSSGVGFIKSGVGTLVLENAANTFGSVGALLDIQGGILAAGSNGALGHLGNNIALNVNSTTEGFRATGTFATDRIFYLNRASNSIEVTQGNVLTLNSGLNLGGTTTPGLNGLNKGGNGVLELGANSPATWTGSVTISAGAIRLRTGGGLGAVGHSVTIANPGAALQLSGTDQVYSSYPISIATSGINNGGALENVSGANLYTGPVTLTADGGVIGSSSGTLTLTGGISAAAVRTLTLAGNGNITLTTAPLAATVGALTKVGLGTATIGVASTAYVGNVVVNAGTLALSGAGRIGGATTNTVLLTAGSTLTVNDSGTPIANRLNNRTTIFNGGSLNVIGSPNGNTVENLTANSAMFGRGLSVITVEAAAGRQTALNINGAFNNPATAQNSGTAPTAASVLFRGTNLGQPLVGTVTETVNGTTVVTHPALVNVAGVTITNAANAILTFSGQTGAKDTTTKGILPWALVDTSANGEGISFATFDTATNPRDALNVIVPGLNPIRPLRPAEMTALITANANMNLVSPQNIVATTNFNSLTLRSGSSLTAGALNQITLSSGGILALAGNAGINNGVLNGTAGNPPLNIWTPGQATSLTITSTLTGGNGVSIAGLVKAGAGTLVLDAPQSGAIAGLSANSLNAMTVVNQGTLLLASGQNTLFPNSFAEVGPGATLDLGGNSQYFQSLFTDGAVEGAGGVVKSTGGAATIVANYDNAARNWAGSIQDGGGVGDTVAYSRSGQNTLSIYSNNTYTGITQVNGGTTILRDAAAFSGTSALEVGFATLNLDNAIGTQNLGNRIKDTAPVTLRGGVLSLLGRPQTETSETLGALTIAPGFSTISSIANSGAAVIANSVYSTDLTFASLTRQAGSVVNFVGAVNTTGTAGSSLGLIGSNPRILFTAAPTLNADLIGGWAVVTNSTAAAEFASYVPTMGVGALGTAGFAQYSGLAVTTGGPTDNIKAATTPTLTASRTINSLNLPAFGMSFTGDATLTLASGGLLHSGASGTIGATAVGQRGQLTAGTTAAPSELFIYNQANTLTINSRIVNNANSGVVSLVLSGGGTITLASQVNNTHGGGTVVNNGLTVNTTGALAGVVVFPTGGLTINGGTVTTNAAGQVASGNVVTFNGPATLNLVGNNTLNSLIFNNTGGTTTPAINSGGSFTFGAGGVTATSSNVFTTSTVAGRSILPSGNTPFSVAPIIFNGVEVAPTQAALALQGLSGTGGITKTGTGALQFNAQAIFTGPVNVVGGSIQFGANNGGSRFSDMNLGDGTRININGQNGNIGSLSGHANSVVTNSSPSGTTLTVGFADTDGESHTFAGRFLRFGDGIPNTLNVTKIGLGTLVLTGAGSDSTATLSVQGGIVQYSGGATSSFGANTVLTGGTLTLDNSTTNTNNRLGGLNANAITLTISGGTVNILGNASQPTTETIDIFTVGTGAGVLDLQQDPSNRLTIPITTTFTGQQVGGTLFIRNLPTLPVPDFDESESNLQQRISLGAIALNAPGAQGTGAVFTDMPIRPDMVAALDDGPATGFVTKDPVTGLLRLLGTFESTQFAELETVKLLVGGSATRTNYDLSSIANIGENTNSNSLVFHDGSGIVNTASDSHGLFGPNATLLTQTVVSGGILAVEGGSYSINVSLLTTGANIPLTFHAYGDLDVNGSVGAGTAGLTKSGGGTMTIRGRGYYTGVTTVNDGVLILDGQRDQSIAVVPAINSALTSGLTMNAGRIDLNDHSQAFGTISSNNINTGVGGEITNSGSNVVTLTSSTNTSSSFSGIITGDLDFVKTGAGTLTLTAPSTYSGTTTIRGGGISLRDRARLETSSVDISYGALTIDQTQLNTFNDLAPVRLAPNTPITMHGGTLAYTAGAVSDGIITFDQLTVNGGANAITVGSLQNAGSTATMTINELTRDSDAALAGTTVNFAANTGGTLGNTGYNNPHLFINTIDGVAPSSLVVDGMLGAWAVLSGNEFAFANNNNEIVNISNTGAGAPNYGSTDITSASTTEFMNINDGTTRTLTGSKTVNSLRVAPNAATVLTLAANTTLTLDSGGLLTNNNNTYQIQPASGAEATTALTAGPGANGQFYIFVNQNTTTLGVRVINGPSTALSLIKGGGGVLTLTGANTYTGKTIVNQGTLTLSNTSANGSSIVTVPGDLLINNATTTLTDANQLRQTAVVTIDGAGTLNMVDGNTVSRVVFNNRGGNSNPIIQVTAAASGQDVARSFLTLTSGGATPSITSVNDVFSTTPTIAATTLTFSNAQPVISTSGSAHTNLLITAPMHQTTGNAFLKTGSGSVAFNPNTTMTSTTFGTDIITVTTNAGLAIGMSVTGTNIPAGTVIDAFLGGPQGTSVRLSNSTTGSATNTLTFTGSTFSQGFTVSEGSLILGYSSVISQGGAVLNGPVGKGTLTLADETSIMSDGTLRTLHNAVNAIGDFSFGPSSSSTATALPGNGVNLAGNLSLTPGDHTISVNGPLNVSTISGRIIGSNGTLTKAGDGTLVLAQANNVWGGPLAITGGVLRNAITNALPAGIDISVSSGAVFDTPGVDQTIRTLTGGGAVTNSSTTTVSTLFIGGLTEDDTTAQVDSTFSGSISGIVGDLTSPSSPATLNLTKVGAGTFTLSGVNTYRGRTDVNSGTLRIASTGRFENMSGEFAVNHGATAEINGTITPERNGQEGILFTADAWSRIRGSGNIGVDTVINEGGILEAVRNGSDNLTFNDSLLTIGEGAIVLFHADALTLNRITITGEEGDGKLSLEGAWTLALEAANFAPEGKTFIIFDGDAGDSLNDGNIGIPNVLLPNGWVFNQSLGVGNFGLQYDSLNNDIVLLGVMVPEPGSASLIAASLAMTLGLQRFRRRRTAKAA